jgi:hypothetical protein
MSGALFDEPDEDEAGYVPTNFLVVPAKAESGEALGALEKALRHDPDYNFAAMVIFESDEEGFENAPAFAQAMKLPPGALPTLEQASEWLGRQRGAVMTRCKN